MDHKFNLVNQAVVAIWDKVRTLLEDGKTFTLLDADSSRYKKCCEFTDMQEDSRFPNISIYQFRLVAGDQYGLYFKAVYCA